MVKDVTPCVGVWIEIIKAVGLLRENRSLPVWECGLKSGMELAKTHLRSHSLCGSVD